MVIEFILGPNVWPFKAAAVKLIIDMRLLHLAPNVGPQEGRNCKITDVRLYWISVGSLQVQHHALLTSILTGGE
jgi:hypothetical protein